MLLSELFVRVSGNRQDKVHREKPAWVNRLRELLHEDFENRRLSELAAELDLHPAHLSRDFARYFGCSFGNYLRMIRLQRAMALLPDTRFSLTDIAFRCHFSDQSHFIRAFKAMYQVTPLQYRHLLLKTRGR